MAKQKKEQKPQKSKWGAEEIPKEEVEKVDVGDYSHIYPNLRNKKGKK